MADIPTVFGSINAILVQGANTASKIKAAISGQPLAPGAVAPVTGLTGKEIGAIVGLVAVVAIVLWFTWKGSK